jgi:hypothetical protein
MTTPINNIVLPFSKLEFSTTFRSWTGLEWIKVSEDTATAPENDKEYLFDPNEMVMV